MIRLEVTDDLKNLKVVSYELNSHRDYLYSFFKKKSKDADFNKAVENGTWDGMDHFMTKEWTIPIGLWKELANFTANYDIPTDVDAIKPMLDLKLNRHNYEKFVKSLYKGILTDKGEPFYPRDYQFEGAYRALKYKFCCEELATSSGKTSIFYTYASYLKYVGTINKKSKMLLIVPNVSLVNQTAKAFHQYSNGLVDWNIHCVGGKKGEFDADKFAKCDMLITTYQSMLNLVPKCLDNKLGNLIMKGIKKGEEEKRQTDLMNLKRKLANAKIMDICSDFSVVCVDECLHPDMMITKSNGDIVKICDIQKGDIVKTVNDNTFDIENREVDYIHKNLSKNNQMYELELDNNETVKITGNHKVKLISGEYKRVDLLTLDDDILSIYD